MAKIRRRFSKGIELTPEDLTLENLSREGELAYDLSDDKLKYRNASTTQEVVDTDSTQILENKTIDATAATGNNTLSADSDDIVYDNTLSGLTATNVKDAIDELQTGLESQNEAIEITYNNSTSGLTATNVQAAIDEVEGRLDTAESNITSVTNDLAAHEALTSGVHGVIGTVVGTSDVQTLTNKTLDDNITNNARIEYLVSEVSTGTGDITLPANSQVVRITGASITGITGIENSPSKDTQLVIINNTGNDLVIYNQDAGETAALRISTGIGDNIDLDNTASLLLQYANGQWNVVGGTGAGGGATSFEINQTTHGFAVGDGIYHNGTNWVKGQADAETTLAYYAVVEVIDADNFVAADFGRIEALAHGFTIGQYYFLSDSVAGQPTTTEPSTGFSNPLFYVEDANTLQVKVYRPAVVGEDINLDQLSDVQVPTPADGDILVYDNGSSLWVNEARDLVQSQTITNNQSVASDITGLLLDGSTYKGYKVTYNIYRDTDTNEVSQTGTLHFAYKPDTTSWQFAEHFGGDDAGVTFSITSGGQVQYTSSDLTGTGYTGTITYRITEKL